MVIKQEVAYGIVESIEELWREQEFQDFTVVVDDTEVKCHSFLLAACSKFFRALFRSGMKETSEKNTSLVNISKETFLLILESLYTGCDVLTNDNLFDIWRAANQLQIEFLEKECEVLAKVNISLDNYELVYQNAKMLNSISVIDAALEFIRKNFEDFSMTETFLNFGYDEFLSMIKSQDLVVTSEDTVIDAIIKWVLQEPFQPSVEESLSAEESKSQKSDNGHKTYENRSLKNNESCSSNSGSADPNSTLSETSSTPSSLNKKLQSKQKEGPENRINYAGELMKSARTLLVSADCLEKLLENNVMMENPLVKEIIHKAILYQLQVGRRHGHLPEEGLHRSSSDFANGLVYCHNTVQVKLFLHLTSNEIQNKLKYLPSDVGNHGVKMVVFDNKIFALTQQTFCSKPRLFILEENSWNELCILPEQKEPVIVSCCNYIFTFDEGGQQVSKLNPCCRKVKVEQCASCPNTLKIFSVTQFDKRILVFSSETNDGTDETGLHCFEPRCETWTRLNNIEGPAMQITSVYDDDTKYILQTNGSLWKVTKDDTGNIDFTLSCQLWNGQCQIWGAFFYQNVFLICGEPEFRNTCTNTEIDLAGQKKTLKKLTHPGPCTGFLPIIVPKLWLEPLE